MIPVIWASPNDDGLTAACARAAAEGINASGVSGELINLNTLHLNSCGACGNGWGICRGEHICTLQDDFERVHRIALDSEALVLVTPVYWGEEAECMKVLLDRLRRCHGVDAAKPFDGRNVIIIAAAGGSGNGTISCLEEMERFARHMGMKVFDAVMVTRFNREYKLGQISQAAAALAIQRG